MNILKPEDIKIPPPALVVEEEEKDAHPILGATLDLGSYLKQKFGEIPPVLFPDHKCSAAVKDIRMQRNDSFDAFDCVTCSHWGMIDTLDNVLSNILPLQSRRYTALKAGTQPNRGTSNYAVQQAILEWGGIAEDKLPSMSDTMTQAQFFASIGKAFDQYEDFKTVYELQFGQVPTFDGVTANNNTIWNILCYSPIVVSVDGNYQFDPQGRVIRSSNNDSHDVCVVEQNPDYYLILDSENPGGFIKFAPDYQLHYPTFAYLKKNFMYQLVRVIGSPAVYVLDTKSGYYSPISDGSRIPGGDLLKVMSGSYKNANIITVDSIPPEMIKGKVLQID